MQRPCYRVCLVQNIVTSFTKSDMVSLFSLPQTPHQVNHVVRHLQSYLDLRSRKVLPASEGAGHFL